MANIVMKYGDYSFTPVPLITIGKEDNKTDSAIAVGTVFNLEMQGTILAPSAEGGLKSIIDLQNELREAFDRDGKHFTLECNGIVLIDCYPRITQNVSFDTSSDNWVLSCPFTLEIQFDDEPTNAGENSFLMPPYIFSANESWSLEFDQEINRYDWSLDSGTGIIQDASPYVLRMTHNVSAVGKMHYSGTGDTGMLDKDAWEQARDYVIGRLGFSNIQLEGSGILNLDANIFGQYNHIRNQNVDELGGSFSVEETWLVVSSGDGIINNALEDFTITNRTSLDSAINTISIEGNIRGLENRSYGSSPGDFNIAQTKYNSALSYWNTVKNRLYYRVQYVSDDDINITPVNNSIGHNPVGGIITYSYEFDNRPCNFISNAKSEVISIRDSNPVDEFARIVVPGRAFGPILQELSTISEFSRSVSIDIIVEPPTGCTNIMTAVNSSPRSGVQELLCDIEQALESDYSQVFKSQDEEQWEFKTGRYSRNITWVAVKCSGAAPDTSVCSE